MSYKYLIFDLDSTLYPYDSGMEQHMDSMIDDFIRSHMDIPDDHVPSLRNSYFTRYGTTIGGLIKHHRINPDQYYRFIHNFDFGNFIAPAPWLKELLDGLDLPKVVFSNSPRDYIGRVLKILGVASCFQTVYDITFCNYFGKPNPDSFRSVLNHLGAAARECVFIDNSLPNIVNAQRLGFTAIWLCEPVTGDSKVSFSSGPIPDGTLVIGDIRELADIVPELMGREGEDSRHVS